MVCRVTVRSRILSKASNCTSQQDLIDYILQLNGYCISLCCPCVPGLLRCHLDNGPLTRYAKLRVAHAPGTFSPPPLISDPDMHHGTCLTYVPWCMSGSLTSGFLWNRWRGKRSRHIRRMCNTQFCVTGKRPMPVKAILNICGMYTTYIHWKHSTFYKEN